MTYSSKALSSAAYLDLCAQVSGCAASLSGCRSDEIECEARYLRTALNELCSTERPRQSEKLRVAAASAVARANEILARRAV
jgi:hypothetical protein